jgi:hypothetical protein
MDDKKRLKECILAISPSFIIKKEKTEIIKAEIEFSENLYIKNRVEKLKTKNIHLTPNSVLAKSKNLCNIYINAGEMSSILKIWYISFMLSLEI